MARAPKRVIEKLEELKRTASLRDASFGFVTDKVTFEGKDHVLDDFLKDKTRSHRESWILPLIDDLLAWAKGGARE